MLAHVVPIIIDRGSARRQGAALNVAHVMSEDDHRLFRHGPAAG